MKKKLAGLLSVILIVVIVSVRLYRKHERAQIKEEQQKEINKQFVKRQKFLREQQEIERKALEKRKSDSLKSIRKAKLDKNIKMLKESMKRLEEEGKKKKNN